MLLLASIACQERDPDEQALVDTFDKLVMALGNHDRDALWELTDSPSRNFFQVLLNDIKEAEALVERHYPESDKTVVKKAVGGDYVNAGTSAEDLFKLLIDPKKLRAPKDLDARDMDSVVVGAYTATVVTKSGVSMEFSVEGEGRFRTGVFLDSFRTQPGLITLRDNIATARKNCAVLADDGKAEPDVGEGR